jgi:5-methylcytosine-specific restriction endonuclease McrA
MSLLNENVLVLNKHYLAVQVAVAKEAIIALVTGKAQVVDETYAVYNLDQWHEYTTGASLDDMDKYPGILRSPSVQLLVPHVIRFPDCEYSSPLIKTVKYSRRNIYQRDGHTCQYCGDKFRKEFLTLDHIIPKSKGGRSSWTNIVTCCKQCNADKGDQLLEDIGWKLLKQPVKPRWNSHIGTPFKAAKKKYWENFLG